MENLGKIQSHHVISYDISNFGTSLAYLDEFGTDIGSVPLAVGAPGLGTNSILF